MKVFKFGGASVKDAAGVRNVQNVLEKTGNGPKVIVISAMGKTTNALEIVIKDYLFEKKVPKSLEAVEETHFQIINELFLDTRAPIFNKIKNLFTELRNFLQHNKSEQYDFVYDQVICYGELVSTTIVSEYLNSQNIQTNWLDARNFIKTDSVYRDAGVNWEETQEAIQQNLNVNQVNITQGFIGSDPNNFTTTLGREGSDYSAAIFAYCLNAENVTIWKDVPGVLNADPRVFKDPQLLQHISYEEAIELAFYGASVIHPKTLQPLQQKEIPLFVKPFLKPESEGTKVGKGELIFPEIPCFIVKNDLVLISLSTLDFSFMVEENISEVFRLFHQYQMKVDLIQNSAISFSVCVDNKFNQLEKLLQHLKARFKVSFVPGVSLYTIRHFNEEAKKSLEKDKEILLKQLTHNTLQIVTRN
ncbi:aspartate kinase [Salegentibacter salegens]|uniref:Aspartokinase n=1 Tax=Salegentibacter salegens TaxID=143223 RepID=A0A1M7MQ16_9FLAO|nr:aspartate kinase [Salegentibacter salegens]PRX52580.1 aspartate kinase [Salegentibacter salegens]SHM93107.1 aspartate kinase [Salegentibacter salegens]